MGSSRFNDQDWLKISVEGSVYRALWIISRNMTACTNFIQFEIRQACKATKSNVCYRVFLFISTKGIFLVGSGSAGVLGEQKELYITAGRFSNHEVHRLFPVYLPHRESEWERQVERMKQIERQRAREREWEIQSGAGLNYGTDPSDIQCKKFSFGLLVFITGFVAYKNNIRLWYVLNTI